MSRSKTVLIFDAHQVLPPNPHLLHIPQLRATLMRLNRPIYRLYILTSDNPAALEQQLKDKQLRHFFHDILTPESFTELDFSAPTIERAYIISNQPTPPHAADAPIEHLASIDDLVLHLATSPSPP
ncbi:HAD family hydrolase [Poriferisphaera corsica]|uniref:hypothetical protein n=1 Tax=Poriferisphaera corsica TaxID=2528020 RepID=UPI0011A70F84|nr:hypothetical protein [Poriferisphaera corsica]